MTDNDISIHDAEYWKRMPLSFADDVLRNTPKGEEAYKSEFSDLIVDLSGRVPTSFARTLTGKRAELSVLECDPAVLDEFVGHLEWLKGNRKTVSYQIGYTRDFSHGKPQLRYVGMEYGSEFEERVF